MRTTRLGASGPAVGAIGLGCMGMTHAYDPSGRDDAASIQVIQRAIDLGVTLIDTADVYGPFTNESLVGRGLAGRREEVVLATKVGLVTDHPGGQLGHDGRPEHVRRSIDGSLARLGVGNVDLYQLHRVDPRVPLEDTWGAMAELVAAGKARAIGLSEVGVDEIARAAAIHPVASVQSELSLWTRDPLAEVLPYCQAHGIGFLPFSPLGRGFLTGRFGSADDLPQDDWRRGNPRFQDAAIRANQAIVERVRAIAAGIGATPAQVALAWTCAQGSYVIPIPGTKTLRHLEDNAGAGALTLGPQELRALDGMPAAVGSRY